MPSQSTGWRGNRSRLRGRKNQARAIPTSPKGMFTKKMRRQPPAASSSPPRAGPTASPSAWKVPWMPMPRPRAWRGMAWTIRATLLAWSIAAPTPWRARKTIRAARLGATPQRPVATMKSAKP